jgi:uncharacterized membrane protein HdeD (DUF308 family)
MDVKKFWWKLALRGGVLAFLALFIFMYDSLQLVFTYWGISMLVIGIGTGIYANRLRVKEQSWFFPAILATLDLVLALIVLIYTDAFLQVFRLIVGGWAVGIGFLLVYMAMRNEKQKWILLINGMVSIGLGILIIVNPFEEGSFDNYLLGLYSLALGGYLILLSFKLKPKAADIPLEIDEPKEED